MKIKKQELFTERDIKGEILYAIRTYENISDSVRLTDEYHAKDIADKYGLSLENLIGRMGR